MRRQLRLPFLQRNHLLMILCFVLTALSVGQLSAQTNELLSNTSFETQTNGIPNGWIFPPRLKEVGVALTLDDDNPLKGNQSALVDTTALDSDSQVFGMLNQKLDPTSLRGKRVRFRAAVRTSDRSVDGKAMLWLRVDRKTEDGKSAIGAFDNMQNRPITDDNWKHYDIVVDIDDDADSLTVGMLAIGKVKAWLDDASLEVVGDDVKLTTLMRPGESLPQPYYNHWLWLALLTIVIMVLSQTKNSFAQRFALRFTVVYWLLYSLPSPFTDIAYSILLVLNKLSVPTENVSWFVGQISTRHKEATEQSVQWVANHVLGIEGTLVLPNGSGDTTFAYIQLLVCFVIAFLIATFWTVAFLRRASDQTWVRDLLRTYLRYVLALTMLGYGLHKAGFIMTQFTSTGVPSEFQLNRTYGDSSPMGLLWTFMAASPMYTFFAGLGEVVGGLLLAFRKTSTLGALVVFGVMANVVMLNFCYDVPVKQYSFHLLFMAVLLVIPDVPRLANVLFFNRPTQKSELGAPPYTNSKTIWIYRVVKGVVLICAFGWPVVAHVQKEVTHDHSNQIESKHLLINRGFRWVNEYPFNR